MAKKKTKVVKAKATAVPKLTAESLQSTLWGTLLAVKNGTIKPGVANAISSQAREICRVTNTQVSVLKLAGTPTKTQVKKLLI